MEEFEEDGGHEGLGDGELRGGRGEFQESFECEAELSGGEMAGEDAEEGVDVKGEVLDRGLGVLGRGEDGEGYAVGGFEDGE